MYVQRGLGDASLMSTREWCAQASYWNPLLYTGICLAPGTLDKWFGTIPQLPVVQPLAPQTQAQMTDGTWAPYMSDSQDANNANLADFFVNLDDRINGSDPPPAVKPFNWLLLGAVLVGTVAAASAIKK